MLISAREIAEVTGGSVAENADRTIHSVSKLEEANSDCLCFFANPKYEHALYASNAGIVIIPEDFTPAKPLNCAVVKHTNPYFAFCIILDKYFNPVITKSGIEDGSYIHSSAKLGESVYVAATAYIEENVEVGEGSQIYPQVYLGRGVKIGSNTILHPGVKIYAGCIVGDNCVIHASTVIGSDGFGFAPVGDIYVKVPQIGNVVLADNVEIGSNCSIDRATMGSTVIGKGTKLDNHIQIAHNVEIGENNVIAGMTAIAGSAKIGNNCQVGGQAGIVGHITIANRTGIGAQSGVTKTISEPGTNWIGSPASPLKDQFRSWAAFKQLPDMISELKTLKKELETLKNSKS